MFGVFHYYPHLICVLLIASAIHHLKSKYYFNFDKKFRYDAIDVVLAPEATAKSCWYETTNLAKEIAEINERLNQIETWKSDVFDIFNDRLEDTLDTFYSDQIGKFDYASVFAGATISATPETDPYPSKQSFCIFGAFCWISKSDPKYIIKPRNLPGECFAFYGTQGVIQINLTKAISIKHVSLEHLHTRDSNDAAPKDFEVFGLERDKQHRESLGRFKYNIYGKIIQTFSVTPRNKTFNLVELKILDNYGNQQYTCVYRFRVHSN